MNKRLVPLIAFLLTLSFQSRAWAWGQAGHMVVAQIAYDNLSDKAKAKVAELIVVKIDPATVVEHLRNGTTKVVDVRKATGTFVTAACWADDVKTDADRNCHFFDEPFSPDGTTPKLKAVNCDVVSALRTAEQVLRSNTTKAKKARQLRYLIHLTGDIHQPLHCATRCTQGHAGGDRGGNDFPLSGGGDELHSFWDGGVKLFPHSIDRPLDQHGIDKIKQLAADCTASNPHSAFAAELKVTDYRKWADDSFTLAKSTAYDGLASNDTPSDTYVTAEQEVVRKRVALAGYRLAALLNDIVK